MPAKSKAQQKAASAVIGASKCTTDNNGRRSTSRQMFDAVRERHLGDLAAIGASKQVGE